MAKKVMVKIDELTDRHGISLRELSRLADVRHAALSELAKIWLNSIRVLF